MSANCLVVRAFRTSILFLSAIGPCAAFTWSNDRSKALKLSSSSALAAAKAHAPYVKPGESGAYAVDALGNMIAPPHSQPAEQPAKVTLKLSAPAQRVVLNPLGEPINMSIESPRFPEWSETYTEQAVGGIEDES